MSGCRRDDLAWSGRYSNLVDDDTFPNFSQHRPSSSNRQVLLLPNTTPRVWRAGSTNLRTNKSQRCAEINSLPHAADNDPAMHSKSIAETHVLQMRTIYNCGRRGGGRYCAVGCWRRTLAVGFELAPISAAALSSTDIFTKLCESWYDQLVEKWGVLVSLLSGLFKYVMEPLHPSISPLSTSNNVHNNSKTTLIRCAVMLCWSNSFIKAKINRGYQEE